MRKQYVVLFCSSTLLFLGVIGIEIVGNETVFAEEIPQIRNPLNPEEEITPSEGTLEQTSSKKPSPVELPKSAKNERDKSIEKKEKLESSKIHRHYKKKTFVDEAFFKEVPIQQPNKYGGDQKKENELSKICYALSGKLIVGREGNNIY